MWGQASLTTAGRTAKVLASTQGRPKEPGRSPFSGSISNDWTLGASEWAVGIPDTRLSALSPEVQPRKSARLGWI